MKSTLKHFGAAGALGLALACFVLAPARAQSPDAAADVMARINRERTSRGMIPYAVSAQLTAAAQAHANDVMRTGIESHTGSDGSTVRDRVQRVGYGAYSWGFRVGENWARYVDVPTAMQMWMNSPPHTHNILHPVYREFGVGIAPYKSGGFIYVVDFGAQPNVLPVFLQTDAAGRASIALSNENYASTGDGANTIGLATQVEISNSPEFPGAQWQPFVARLAWTPPAGSGAKSVYVKFRDARGRTVTSSDSLDPSAPATLVPVALAPTVKPSPTNTARPKPTATRALVAALAPTATPTDVPSPTQVAASDATATPGGQTLAPYPYESAVVALTETPEALPPDSAESVDARAENLFNPATLGIFGVAGVIGLIAGVNYLRRQANK